MPRGSAIVGPLGEYIKEPVYGQEEILLADLDLRDISSSQFDFDVVGHYSRPDVFQLVVNEEKRKCKVDESMKSHEKEQPSAALFRVSTLMSF